ncbi:MAG: NAD(P)-dependent oxidoreductase [Chloroflexota bacterium]|nr:NAD(P)-dependent oxidoreductase [Chloroflexota bacterium]
MGDAQIRVGVIGLGKMGQPITRNLLKKGFTVVVHNRSSGATEALVGEGATDGGSPHGVAQQADVIITSLPDPTAVRAVYLDQDGLVDSASSGQLYIDTSTVGPGLSRELAEKVGAKGAAFLDAPVSGGVAGAEAGSLTIMVGGDAEAFANATPVLEAIGQKLHLVGPSGSGTVIKLANQLLVGINMAAVAEALVLGVKAGADPAKMLEVLSTSFGGSKMLDRGVPLIIDRNFAGGTPVDLIRKDLGLIADLAEQLGVPLATGNQARAVFDRAHDTEHGAEDMTAVVLPIEQDAGVEVVRAAPAN